MCVKRLGQPLGVTTGVPGVPWGALRRSGVAEGVQAASWGSPGKVLGSTLAPFCGPKSTLEALWRHDDDDDDGDDDDDDDDNMNGEAVCEGKNFNRGQCRRVGCCYWEEGECWSAVGRNKCDRFNRKRDLGATALRGTLRL